MRVEQQDVYISEDNQTFTSEEACIAHEKKQVEIKKRYEKLNVYTVSHSFEATEGRGYFGRTHILTDQDLSIVLDYCFHRWGEILRPWYVGGYYEAWKLRINSRDVEAALRDEGHKDRWLWKPVDVVFLSNKPLDIDDFPARVWVWPRPTPPTGGESG
ncbi:MAG: hypothetical protein ACX94B_13170 [Henriciella sp.]